MNTRTFAFAVFAAFSFFIGVGVAQQKRPQDVDLQAAIRTETVDGDLNGAIGQYSAIVAKYKTDRVVMATALVHLAECYRKLGDAQARPIFVQVLRDYADQPEAATIARARLAGTATSAMNSKLVWSGPKVDNEGTVSPDGRYLSFTDWDTGDLAVHEFATGADRRITDAAKGANGRWPEFAEESAISRDGRRVAYSWWQEKTGKDCIRTGRRTDDASSINTSSARETAGSRTAPRSSGISSPAPNGSWVASPDSSAFRDLHLTAAIW